MSTSRRSPWRLLIVAFILVPLVEIYAIVQVGQVIGAWWTIALLVADSIIGGWLVRREGRRAWQALNSALQQGRMPANELADGALILIGGTLMLTPGFVSDVFGILLILPFTRPLGRRVLARAVSRRLTMATGPAGTYPGQTHRPAGSGGFRDAQGDTSVVTGEVVD